jgi:hypothetical protein
MASLALDLCQLAQSAGGDPLRRVQVQGGAPRVLPRSKLSDAELAACRVQYDALVSAMRELATRHSLNVANVLGECTLPADIWQPPAEWLGAGRTALCYLILLLHPTSITLLSGVCMTSVLSTSSGV